MSVEFCEGTSSYYVNNNSWQILFKKKNPFDLNIFLSHVKYGRKITTAIEKVIDKCSYMSLVGSLPTQFCQANFMPHYAWIVNMLSRFVDKSMNTHWLPRKHVHHYLQVTMSLELVYPRVSDFNLE